MERELLQKEEEIAQKIRSGITLRPITIDSTEKKADVTHFTKPYITQFSSTDPVPKNESSFEDWKLEIQCLIKSGAYPEYAVTQMIRNSLKDPARKAAITLGSSATSQEIITKLENVFGNVASGESVLTEF